jgi:histidinol phosphatase-like PHP family hydrolase
MIDLHTHTLFSDGELIPSELVRRVEALAYEALALTDHADSATLDFIVPRIVKVADELNKTQSVKVIPGVELTHLPPEMIPFMVKEARKLGAALVVVHGESIVEPVAPGTNRAGLEAGADILAHPGLISHDDAMLAAEKGVFLEISGRAGHSLTNGHVVNISIETGAKLVLNSDAHSPRDLMDIQFAASVIEGAGLPRGAFKDLLANSRILVKKAG